MSDNTRAIECAGLTRRFGATVAVDNVSLSVETGRTLALLGPSGCGKTTLLRLIAGFERPDAGRIRIRGRTVVDGRRFVPPNRRHIGFVFQEYALFPHLTVRDNVGFGLRSRASRSAFLRSLSADRNPGSQSASRAASSDRDALAHSEAPQRDPASHPAPPEHDAASANRTPSSQPASADNAAGSQSAHPPASANSNPNPSSQPASPYSSQPASAGSPLPRASARGSLTQKIFSALQRGFSKGFSPYADPIVQARIDEMLDLVGLKAEGDRMPHELSGGQQQRVALARALAPNPDLVLLDEPFSNLDASLRSQVREDLSRILKAAGATAIFVTHDQEEALSLGDAVAVMHQGRLLEIDSPRDVYLQPIDRQVASIVGKINLLPGQSDGDAVRCALGRLRLARPCAAGSAQVLLRPEALSLSDLNGADRAGDSGVEAVIASVRFHGNHQHVRVRLGDGEVLSVRVGPSRRFEPGERVWIAAAEPVIGLPVQCETFQND